MLKIIIKQLSILFALVFFCACQKRDNRAESSIILLEKNQVTDEEIHHKNKIEAELLNSKTPVSIIIKERKSLSSSSFKSENYDIGIAFPWTALRLKSQYKNLQLFYALSPSPNSKCALEITIVTSKDSNLVNIVNLKDKNLAVTNKALANIGLLFPELNTNKIKFNKLLVGLNPIESLELLREKKVDGIIISQIQMENAPKFKTDLGAFYNGRFDQEDLNLKNIYSTNHQLPCRVLFSRDYPRPTDIKTMKSLEAMANKRENRVSLLALLQTGSITPLDEFSIQKIFSLVKDYPKVSLEQFANKIE